jgi:hypothetical protein
MSPYPGGELETPYPPRDTEDLPDPTPTESGKGRGTPAKPALLDGGVGKGTRHLATERPRRPAELAFSASLLSSSREDIQVQVAKLLCAMYPRQADRPPTSSIRSIVNEAYEYTSNVFERSAAIQWAERFRLPSDVHERDETLLRVAGVRVFFEYNTESGIALWGIIREHFPDAFRFDTQNLAEFLAIISRSLVRA